MPKDSAGFLFPDPVVHPESSILTPQRISATVTNPAFKCGRARSTLSLLNVHAFLETNQGSNKDLAFVARTPGSGGTAITVAYVVAGLNTVLSVAVASNAITVNLGTDAGGAATINTATDVMNAILASAAATNLVWVFLKTGNDGTGKPGALGATNLIDVPGSSPTLNVTMTSSIDDTNYDANFQGASGFCTFAQVTAIAGSGQRQHSGNLGSSAKWVLTLGGTANPIFWITIISKIRPSI